MRKFFLLLLLLPAIARAEFFTGNQLLARMNGSQLEQMQAIGFVQGVFDVYTDVTFCPPNNVTAGQVHDIVKNHLTQNPAIRHRTAESLINEVLRGAWPCANSRRSNNVPGRGA